MSPMLYFIGWSLFLIFSKLFLRFKVVGRENIPPKGAFIFASNHSSFLDPILLGISAHRSLNYMARDTLFNTPAGNWVMRKVHSFPIRRHESDASALKQTIKVLESGKPLVIFPEGTRSKDGELKRGKRGIGFMAAKTKAPVLPAYVKGSFGALPRGVKTIKFVPVMVYIGELLSFDELVSRRKSDDIYQDISDLIMAKIGELKAKYDIGDRGPKKG